MVCNADKVIGNKPTKQRYVRLFRKDSKCCSGREADVLNTKYVHGLF